MSIVVRNVIAYGRNNLKMDIQPGDIVLNSDVYYIEDGTYGMSCVILEADKDEWEYQSLQIDQAPDGNAAIELNKAGEQGWELLDWSHFDQIATAVMKRRKR